MTARNSDTLETLLAKQALHELAMTYCRAVDRRDYVLLQTVYHQGASENRGAIFNGSAQGFIDMAAQDSGNYEATIHRIFNTLFVVQGDSAEGEIYLEAYHRTKGEDSQEIIVGGRFFDRYEKRDGRWAVIARTAAMDCCTARPVDRKIFSEFVAGALPGTANTEDISYSLSMLKQLSELSK